MAGRYIPPHLRNQHTPASSSPADSPAPAPPIPIQSSRSNSSYSGFKRSPKSLVDDAGLYSRREIHAHFWKDGEQSADSPESTTLHTSAANPDGLGYVLLFHGANPKWESDKIIFVKSNLGILPSTKPAPEPAPSATSPTPDNTTENPIPLHTDDNGFPMPHPAFAVFEEPYRGSPQQRSFKFVGWYHISRLQLLEPESEGLLRMLHEKWKIVDKRGNVKQRQRDAKAWEASMKHRWAVMKMEFEDEAMKEKGEPRIDRIEEEDATQSGKSVNELLQEMRLGKDAGAQRDTPDQGGRKEGREVETTEVVETSKNTDPGK